MSGRRILAIVVGVVGILILLLVVYLLVTQGDDQPEEAAAATPVTVVDGTPVTPAPAVTPSATIDPSSQMVEVVVSLQTVPRGWQMTEAELTTEMRLAAEVGTNFITRLEDAIGRYARQDVYQGETMTTDTLVRDPTLIGVENFGPSSLVPQGWVAMAIPTDRLSSVAYGVRPGDSVDVMLTFTLSSIDQDFHFAADRA
jgi:Flp pilus assembly protein CpaB